MARARSTFGKLQRDQAKKDRARAKMDDRQARRDDRAAASDEPGSVEPGEVVDQTHLLEQFAAHRVNRVAPAAHIVRRTADGARDALGLEREHAVLARGEAVKLVLLGIGRIDK